MGTSNGNRATYNTFAIDDSGHRSEPVQVIMILIDECTTGHN